MSPPPTSIPVLLAPALAIDQSMSMDLYLENLLAAFAAEPDERFRFEVVVPTGASGRLDKQRKRYLDYPRLLTARARQTRAPSFTSSTTATATCAASPCPTS